MLSILTEQNVQRELRELRDGDILIAPTLNPETAVDRSSPLATPREC